MGETAAEGSGPRRAVVTGTGVVCRRGLFSGDSLESLREAPPTPDGRVPGFSPRRLFDRPKSIKVSDRRSQLAVAASRLAANDAHLQGVAPERIGVVVGSTLSQYEAGELWTALGEDADQTQSDIPLFGRRMMAGLNPMCPLRHLPNMLSAHVSIERQTFGPSLTLTAGGCSGLDALATAAELLVAGEMDAAFAGGSDDPLSPENRSVLEATGGGNSDLAEGAAVVVLEDAAGARARGAEAKASLDGWSSSAGGCPPDELARDLIAEAMRRAGWTTDDATLYSPDRELARALGAVETSALGGDCYSGAGVLSVAHAMAAGRSPRAVVVQIGPTGCGAAVALTIRP